MSPLTVTAHLLTPPVADRALYLDALLLAGMGARCGAAHPSGWVSNEEVEALPLPLARVETEWGWWYAASATQPWGPESTGHKNRVPLVEEAARWTRARSINQATGPDKRLRIPYFTRPGMLEVQWTCIGEPREVGALLLRVRALGKYAGDGHGWVERWTVTRGGPALEAYGRDLRLRHLPAEMRVPMPPAVTRREMPLRPPYHRRERRDRDGAVSVWQVTRATPGGQP